VRQRGGLTVGCLSQDVSFSQNTVISEEKIAFSSPDLNVLMFEILAYFGDRTGLSERYSDRSI
jgi:hypothetical protein